MSKAKYWWHDSDYDGSNFAWTRTKEAPKTAQYSSWSGPFNTFGDAKKDAMDYHKAILEHAKYSLWRIKNDVRASTVEEYNNE